jgi:hypothetical protein
MQAILPWIIHNILHAASRKMLSHNNAVFAIRRCTRTMQRPRSLVWVIVAGIGSRSRLEASWKLAIAFKSVTDGSKLLSPQHSATRMANSPCYKCFIWSQSQSIASIAAGRHVDVPSLCFPPEPACHSTSPKPILALYCNDTNPRASPSNH